MKKTLVVLVVTAALACVACGTFKGVFKSPLEKEYAKLDAEKTATESSVAEDLYDKAEKFVARVRKTKDAPDGLLAKARGLQQRRARDFAKATVKSWDIASAGKVIRALTGSNLNPEAEAKRAGIDLKKLEEDRKFLKSDDPRDWK